MESDQSLIEVGPVSEVLCTFHHPCHLFPVSLCGRHYYWHFTGEEVEVLQGLSYLSRWWNFSEPHLLSPAWQYCHQGVDSPGRAPEARKSREMCWGWLPWETNHGYEPGHHLCNRDMTADLEISSLSISKSLEASCDVNWVSRFLTGLFFLWVIVNVWSFVTESLALNICVSIDSWNNTEMWMSYAHFSGKLSYLPEVPNFRIELRFEPSLGWLLSTIMHLFFLSKKKKKKWNFS